MWQNQVNNVQVYAWTFEVFTHINVHVSVNSQNNFTLKNVYKTSDMLTKLLLL